MKHFRKLAVLATVAVLALTVLCSCGKAKTYNFDSVSVENAADSEIDMSGMIKSVFEPLYKNSTLEIKSDTATIIIDDQRNEMKMKKDGDKYVLSGDYSTRMERIKSKVMPETIATKNYDDSFSNQSYYDNNALTSSDLSGIGRNRFKMPFGQKNYSRPYANYGDMTGGSAMLPNNPNLNDELSQLEYETFGTEFSNEDTATRIKRLNSVSKAKKSTSKYDSNKFSQRMSTAMEIGAMILMILAMVL